MKRNIILIGFMGCGKTCVGRRLSYRARMTFVDTDKEIEKLEQMSVVDIFREKGEQYFREMETEVVKILLTDSQKHVISVGGGLPITEKNRALLRKLGTVVFLRVKPETICRRLKEDTTRPLLQGPDAQKKIRDLMEKRNPVYQKLADVVIDTDRKSFHKIIKEIMNKAERKQK